MRILLVVFALAISGCARNVDYIKEHAKARWAELGYSVVGYEGYFWSPTGGQVWHVLKREDSPGIIYSGFLVKWGDELHVYGPTIVSGNQYGLTEK